MRLNCGSRELVAAAGALGAAVGVLAVGRLLWSRAQRARLRRVRLAKAAKLQTAMAVWKARALEKITEEHSEALVSLSFSELHDQLQNGRLTAMEVLNAYQRKAAVENEKYNFICEPIEEAEELAMACDSLADKKSKPLLGIPFSVKENIEMKGYDCTLGVASRMFMPAKENCYAVQVMIDQGAIPFIRTNMPQLGLAIDCDNPLYGFTLNPHDPKRSPAGSSGGEGAALGCGASIVGLGNDLAGSLRMPAAWCGVCSLKPTTLRIPWPSMGTNCAGQSIVRIVTGPMARSVDGLVALSRVLLSPEVHTHDPYVSSLPFSSEVISDRRHLRIGYFYETGVVSLSRSSVRAVEEVKAMLESRGHELVPWSPPRMDWAVSSLFMRCLTGDGGLKLSELLKHEELSPVIQAFADLFGSSVWKKKLLALCLRLVLPPHMWNFMVACIGEGSVSNWWHLQEIVGEYRKETVTSWRSHGLDALICPVMPCPAMLCCEPGKVAGLFCNAALFNLLDYPAGVLPVTKVSQEDEEHDALHYPVSDQWHEVIKQNLQGSAGLPVAVQCVALPHEEELCLRLMQEVEECILGA